MKKLIAYLAIICMACTFAIADTIETNTNLLGDIEVHQGLVYSALDEEFKSITAVELLSYDSGYGVIGLDAGYAVDKTGIVAVCYKLGGLDKLGIQTPFSKYFNIKIGIYGGYCFDKDSTEYGSKDRIDYGAYTNLVSFKF